MTTRDDQPHYAHQPPSVAELMDNIRENAQALSDAIYRANRAGISVSLQAKPRLKPDTDEPLLTVVYHF